MVSLSLTAKDLVTVLGLSLVVLTNVVKSTKLSLRTVTKSLSISDSVTVTDACSDDSQCQSVILDVMDSAISDK